MIDREMQIFYNLIKHEMKFNILKKKTKKRMLKNILTGGRK